MSQHITPEEAEQLARKAAVEAVEQVLKTLGVDVDNVQETQRDFAFNRKQRIVSEQVSTWTRRTIYVILISGIISLIATGAGEAIKKFIH